MLHPFNRERVELHRRQFLIYNRRAPTPRFNKRRHVLLVLVVQCCISEQRAVFIRDRVRVETPVCPVLQQMV